MKDIFTYLPIPVDDKVPEGYRLIVAYAKDDTVVIPIDLNDNIKEEHHNCDWEGCTTLHHVVKFSIKHKYETEDLIEKKNKK
jgi:hypothetical protein